LQVRVWRPSKADRQSLKIIENLKWRT